jgi:hypothetical protein
LHFDVIAAKAKGKHYMFTKGAKRSFAAKARKKLSITANLEFPVERG